MVTLAPTDDRALSRRGARPSRGFISLMLDSAGAASAWRGSLAFGGVISLLKELTVPMQSNGAHGGAGLIALTWLVTAEPSGLHRPEGHLPYGQVLTCASEA
jgi:hypothetical protein